MPAFLRWLLALGPTNPIVVRLVQNGSRRTRHMYIRTAYLAVLIAVLLWALLLTAGQGALSYRELAAAGASSFEYVAYLQIGLICLLAPVFMAGAIAQEANPRTWEVMLTTPLSGPQIVLGNLFGRLFFVLALLVSSLPLFAITQYFGGVPGQAIFASYAIAACAALLVGAIAVFLSVGRIAGRRAVFAFYIAVVTYLGVTLALDQWLRGPSGGVTIFTALNPFLALRALVRPSEYPIPDTTTLAGLSAPLRFWLGSPVAAWCAASVGFSALLMFVSALISRRAAALEGRSLFSALVPARMSSGERVRAPKAVWHNSIAWREAASRAATLPSRLGKWGFIGAGLLWGLALVLSYHAGGLSSRDFRFALLATTWTELAIITLVAVNMAATAVSREREDGTLDILLTTPITPAYYLRGKLRGLISFLAPLLAVPLLTIAFAALYTLIGGDLRQGGVMVNEAIGANTYTTPVVLPEGALLAPIVVVPFMAFVVMIGLQWSIKTRGTIGSVIFAFGVIATITGVVGLCGWQAGVEAPYIGPALAALNPATLLYAVFTPGHAMTGTLADAQNLFSARVSLAIGAASALAIYAGVVYGLYASMVRRFDMTVRALAGQR